MITMLAAGVLALAAPDAPNPDAPEETAQYLFMLGSWDLETKTMAADRSIVEGTGVMDVYFVHDGYTIQADMSVAAEDGSGFVGSTIRTFDEAQDAWAVTWVPAGAPTAPSGSGTWDAEGERMVETFPPVEDQYGTFTQTLVVSDISEDAFSVRMDRQYENGGPTIEGVWAYEARRRAED